MTFTHALATNNYGEAKLIVATSAANGTHTTLTSAMAAASVGDTIFLRDSVTENVTITPGVNIAAWSGGSLNTPSITGTLTMTAAGTNTISGLELITNSAALIAVTGSAASILNVNNCYLNFSNNTGITFSSSSSSARVNINSCTANLGTTGIAYFSDSSAGTLHIFYSDFKNSGGSSTASTKSAGLLSVQNSVLAAPLTYSSSNTSSSILNCDYNTNAQNATCITTSGTGTLTIQHTNINSGTASALSAGAGTTIAARQCVIFSSNTNAVTGAGTFTYSGLSFSSTSSTINTTTQTVQSEGPSRTIGSSNSGLANTLTITNSSNTASSTANCAVQVAGGTAADPTHQSIVSGVTTWTWGIDNSDSDAWVLAQGTALGTNNVMRSSTAGEINYPLQPAFLATHGVAQDNSTGAGTVVTVNFTTEIFDQNSDYDGTNTFTAPVTGKYFFSNNVRVAGLTVAMTSGNTTITTSNRDYTANVLNYGAVGGGGTICDFNITALADMDAADICQITQVVQNGAGDTADLPSSNAGTVFSGCLLF